MDKNSPWRGAWRQEMGGRGHCVCYACCRELLWPEPRLGAGPLYKYALIMSSAKSAANLRAKGEGGEESGTQRGAGNRGQ